MTYKEQSEIRYQAILKLETKIQQLEKENAGLKEYNKVAIIKQQDEQLTKAKEIIAELIRFQPYIDREAMFHRIGNELKRAIYEGIQFLKEVSE